MNTASHIPQSVTLYYRQGTSDKIYRIAIEPSVCRFVVNFAYGRRGATLSTGTKTSSPVDYATAKLIYDTLVSEKKAKGYTEGGNGTPYQHTDKHPSGILPQLLNSVEESEVKPLLADDNYSTQEKYDGRHLLARKRDGRLEGINKKGFIVGLPETVARELRQYRGSLVTDGESIGDDYHVFDLLELDSEDLRHLPYRERYSRLADFLLLSDIEFRHVRFVESAFKPEQKTKLWEQLRRENREGIVFKRLDAPYVPGRPNSGGPQLKFKFVATVSAIVAKTNQKRSVEVALLQGRDLVSCGNVSIPPNHEIPPAGAIVEVRYLYAYRDSLALYQPVYLGLRTDVDTNECVVSQLKFKAK